MKTSISISCNLLLNVSKILEKEEPLISNLLIVISDYLINKYDNNQSKDNICKEKQCHVQSCDVSDEEVQEFLEFLEQEE